MTQLWEGQCFFVFSLKASPTFSYMGKHSVFFNAHDLDWLIFPIINYISEECEAVSFGPSLLHLRSLNSGGL